MKCENIFCIYWKNNKCILDKITLDIKGVCQECIYINISENKLKRKRNEILYKYKIK